MGAEGRVGAGEGCSGMGGLHPLRGPQEREEPCDEALVCQSGPQGRAEAAFQVLQGL